MIIDVTVGIPDTFTGALCVTFHQVFLLRIHMVLGVAGLYTTKFSAFSGAETITNNLLDEQQIPI